MLKGENIILRPLKISDLDDTLAWRNDIYIKRMTMMHPFPITETVEKEWYLQLLASKSNKDIFFAITKKDDKAIGFISLNNINYTNKNCTLAIVIGVQNEQGKGYGEESLKLLIAYAFNTLNLLKISLEVTANNYSAIKLYSKLGFIEEGCLKRHYYSDGKYLDVYFLSKFRDS